MKNATGEKARQASKLAEPHVNNWLLAKAHAELMRERVNAIWREVLAEHPLHDAYNGERITEQDRTWLAPESDWRRVFAVADARVRAEVPGAADLPDGHCPALVAERIVTECEWAMCAAVEPVFGVSHGDVLCAGMEKLRQYIDLLVKLVVNRPDYVAPKIAA